MKLEVEAKKDLWDEKEERSVWVEEIEREFAEAGSIEAKGSKRCLQGS